MKIAILGGSFDPIHQGHIAMARHVLRHHLVQEVWFMVAQSTPLKDRQMTPFAQRVEMTRAALRHERHMRVCTLEGERSGKSYTVDTVRECKRRYPGHEFVWLIGNDQAQQLDRWKDIETVSKEIVFYVFPRKTEAITCAYPHQAMTMKLWDVSSTMIRHGHGLWLVPKAVRRMMAKQYLYVESYAQGHLQARRFQHCQSVAALCVKLAAAHDIDPQKAYVAGMLHDICKEWDRERLRRYLGALDPKRLDEAAPIWHGYAGAYYVAQALGIHDDAIFRAIYHHVTGADHMPLAMIVYAADKLDPSRGYDSSSTINLCLRDLDAGIQQVKEQQNKYIKKERETIHGSSISSSD